LLYSDLSENEQRKGMFLGYDVVSLSLLDRTNDLQSQWFVEVGWVTERRDKAFNMK
jgi:hypothetical protein